MLTSRSAWNWPVSMAPARSADFPVSLASARSAYCGLPWQATTGQARDRGNDASRLATGHRALSNLDSRAPNVPGAHPLLGPVWVFSWCYGPRVKRKEALLTGFWNAVASLAGRLEALPLTVRAIDSILALAANPKQCTFLVVPIPTPDVTDVLVDRFALAFPPREAA
jgi:hypothetical protein